MCKECIRCKQCGDNSDLLAGWTGVCGKCARANHNKLARR